MSSLGDFTAQAEAYGRSRPGYPVELVERLLDRVQPPSGARVVDLAAGTGIFTSLLRGRGCSLTAVEPNPAMRAQAPNWPDVTWVDGTFEATGLPTASADWITTAQAFHWADPPRALPELHRTLVRGGAFTALWNVREMDGSPVLEAARAILEDVAPGFREHYRQDETVGEKLSATGHFANPWLLEVRHSVEMSAQRFLELWRSHNHLSVQAGPEGMEEILKRLRRLLDETGTDRLSLPYRTHATTVWAV